MRGLPARPSLRGHVTEYLFDSIIHGSLRPGTRIVEGTLARQLGVSQGTLREALQQIEYQGLVTKIDRRGTFVVKLTPQDVKNIYAVRLELEPLAAELARDRMTEEDFGNLENLIKAMQKAGRRRSYIDLVRLDFSFHRLLWQLSGNGCIGRALNAVCPPLFANFMVRVSSGKLYDFERDREQHSAIVEALRKSGHNDVRDAVAAIIRTFEAQDLAYVGKREAKERAKAIPARRGHRVAPPQTEEGHRTQVELQVG